MKTLTGYLNKTGSRIDEAASGMIDVGNAQYQIIKIIEAFNQKTLGLAEAQLKETKKYIEKATWQNVEAALGKWQKKRNLSYNDEISQNGNEWWDMYTTALNAVYKYGKPYNFDVIEADEQFETALDKEYKELADKIVASKAWNKLKKNTVGR